MGHGLALKLTLALLGLWLAVMAAVIAAAPPPMAGDRALVVFPTGSGGEAALTAVSRADGLLVQATWWPDAWIAIGRQDDFAERLSAEGAVAVLPAGAFRLASVGGCGFPIFRWRLDDKA